MGKRLDYVDIAKYIVISLVILGHLKMPDGFLQWIYAFHMPFFFFISGYTFQKKTFSKKWIAKKVKSIYVPFLLFALIFCFGKVSSWVYIAYGSRNGLEMADTNTVLWFLPCFFVAIIAFSLLMSINNADKLKHVLNVLMVAILVVIAKILEVIKIDNAEILRIGYPFNFDMSIVGVVFMYVGYYIRQLEYFIKQHLSISLMISAGMLFLSSTLVYYNLPQSLNPNCPHVEMSVGSLGNGPLFFFNAIGLSIVTLVVSMVADRLIKYKRAILYVGQNSLILMCIHSVLLSNLSKIVDKMGFVVVNEFDVILKGLIIYLITVVASIPIIKLLNSFCPNLAGK